MKYLLSFVLTIIACASVAAPFIDADEPLAPILRIPNGNAASSVAIKRGSFDHVQPSEATPVVNIQQDIMPNRPADSAGVGLGMVVKTNRHGHPYPGQGDLPAFYNFGGWLDDYAWVTSGPGGRHDSVGTFGICRSMEGSNASCWGLYGHAILRTPDGQGVGAEVVVANSSGQEAPTLMSFDKGRTFGFSIVGRANDKSAWNTVAAWIVAQERASFHHGFRFSRYSIAPEGVAIDMGALGHKNVKPIILPPGSGIWQQSGLAGLEQIIGPRAHGWTLPTGTQQREGYDADTATCADTAATLAALLHDLAAHGLIGR